MASHLLDEVEKVCSHVIVLREGKKLHKGRTDEMTASFGIIEIKTDTEKDNLIQVLGAYDGIGNIKKDHLNTLIVTLEKEITASDINSYLFKNGIIVSHLVKRKPRLEQQFLDLTNND